MTEEIRRAICRRRGIFKRLGRNSDWKNAKKRTNGMIKKRREAYNKNTREKFIHKTDSKSFSRDSVVLLVVAVRKHKFPLMRGLSLIHI